GLDGYFDISTGKQVIIRNQSGGIIAATKFEADATASTSERRCLHVVLVADQPARRTRLLRPGD
ncbi:MAG: hypothetical protein ACR2OU_19815, partial [Thermomicrobiales bacterium]